MYPLGTSETGRDDGTATEPQVKIKVQGWLGSAREA